jgi:hypothetical protein
MIRILFSILFCLLFLKSQGQEIPNNTKCDSTIEVTWSRHARSYWIGQTRLKKKEAEDRVKLFPPAAIDLHKSKRRDRIGAVVFCTSLGLLIASRISYSPIGNHSNATSNVLMGTAIAGMIIPFPLIRNASKHHREAFKKYNQQICDK